MKISEFSKRFLIFFLKVVLLELTLGGGGRNISFGFFTLRMYLFFVAIILAIYLLIERKKADNYLVGLCAFYFILLTLSTVIGFLNGAPIDLVFEDVKPLSYFFIILFYYVAIRNTHHIEIISKTIKFSSSFLAIAYIVVIILLHYKILNFRYIYTILSQTGEFFFRGELAFFYKGFLYLCIGFFFFANEKNTKSKVFCLIIFLQSF